MSTKTGTSTGGGNLVEFFTCATDHTTVGSAAVYSAGKIEGTNWAKDEGGIWKGTFTQTNDSEDFYTFVDTYAPPPDGSVPNEIIYEDGTKEGGSTSGSADMFMTYYAATVNDGTTTKRKIWSGFVKVAQSSGSFTTKDKEFAKPTLEVVAQKALAQLAVNTKFNTAKASTAATSTLLTGRYGKITYAALS